MFEHLDPAPPDPILGLTEAFHRDPRPDKINLSVGIYQDDAGHTPILACVKQAERHLLEAETTKGYLAIEGSSEYVRLVAELVFSGTPALAERRVATAHTPGGTAALRVAADWLHTLAPNATVWLSDPTWPNHPGVFRAAGVRVAVYPYFDAADNSLALDRMLDALDQAAPGDVVLLHGCCHNPTGVDLSAEAWTQVADLVERRGLLPLVDFAYQGFGDGIREDALGLVELCRRDIELLVCSSFSKNFGLYNERVGALSVVGRTPEGTQAAFSHIKQAIRANYSNPPAHGGAAVATVLADARLRALWQDELTAMRNRIHHMRELFAATLAMKQTGINFSFITRQRGMFSFSGLRPAEVAMLRDKYGIYVVGSGRINVAGMSERTMDRLCTAIADVLAQSRS